MAVITTAVAAFVISAASAAYQVIQAKKAQEKADKAAEARKGFEMPVEGESGSLALVYGRALIGGRRTWHETSGSFRYVTSNADKVFETGATARAAHQINYKYYDPTYNEIGP